MKLPKELTAVTPLSKYLAMILFIALPFVGFFLGMRYQEMMNFTDKDNDSSMRACTLDAKICPDGSAVGRTGPNCEFSACPSADSETANWKTYVNNEWRFSLKYPNHWSVEPPEKEYRNLKNQNYRTFRVSFGPIRNEDHMGQKVSPAVSPIVGIEVFDTNGEEISIKDAAVKYPYYCGGGSSIGTSGITRKIGGREALIFKRTSCGLAGSAIAYIIDGKYFYSIVDYQEENLDQILSTFQFTN